MVNQDIQEFDPHVYSGLKHILEFDGDLESALCMTFQVSYDVYGETKYHNLIVSGVLGGSWVVFGALHYRAHRISNVHTFNILVIPFHFVQPGGDEIFVTQ